MNFRALFQNAGLTAKPLALRMGSTGNGTIQRVNRYKSNSPSVISAECDIAQAAGLVGFIHIWDGLASSFITDSMLGMWQECAKRRMVFGVMLDQWIAKNQKPNPTEATINAINSPSFQQVLKSPCYLAEKYILEFNLATSAAVNMSALRAAFPKNPILSEGTGYSWPNASSSNPVATLAAQNKLPSMMIPGLCLQFFDGGYPKPNGVNGQTFSGRDWSGSVWGTGPTRAIEGQGGNYFLDQLNITPKTAKYAMFATWDDFEEGTALLHFLSMMTGKRVS